MRRSCPCCHHHQRPRWRWIRVHGVVSSCKFLTIFSFRQDLIIVLPSKISQIDCVNVTFPRTDLISMQWSRRRPSVIEGPSGLSQFTLRASNEDTVRHSTDGTLEPLEEYCALILIHTYTSSIEWSFSMPKQGRHLAGELAPSSSPTTLGLAPGTFSPLIILVMNKLYLL